MFFFLSSISCQNDCVYKINCLIMSLLPVETVSLKHDFSECVNSKFVAEAN